MALVFNIPSVPHNTFTAYLDGRQYKLTFRWSSRTSKWFMDMYTFEGVPVTIGVAVLPNTPLINKTSVFSPTGNLYLVRQDSTGSNPTRTNIGYGRSFELTYYSKEELQQ